MSPAISVHRPSWIINMFEPHTQFNAYFINSLNGMGKHNVREGWLVVGMYGGGGGGGGLTPDR